jgi:hypothetical protein
MRIFSTWFSRLSMLKNNLNKNNIIESKSKQIIKTNIKLIKYLMMKLKNKINKKNLI